MSGIPIGSSEKAAVGPQTQPSTQTTQEVRVQIPLYNPRPNAEDHARGLKLKDLAKIAVIPVLLVVTVISFLYRNNQGYGFWLILGVDVVAFLYVLRKLVVKQRKWGQARPIPKMGWQHVLYIVLRLLRISYVPKLGIKEKIQNEVNELETTSEAVGPVEIAVFGPKGGVGKSWVAIMFAALFAQVTHLQTCISDSRGKRGDIASRFGMLFRRDDDDLTVVVPRATPTNKQLIRYHKSNPTMTAVVTCRILRRVPGLSLYVIASGKKNQNREDGLAAAFKALMDHLIEIFRCIVHEADNVYGDDISNDFDIELMSRCQVPVFVTRVNMAGAHLQTADVLDFYRGTAAFRKKIHDRGILIVLATKKKHNRETFAKMFDFPPEQVFLVPFDPYFDVAEEDKDVAVTRFEKDGDNRVAIKQEKAPDMIVDTQLMSKASMLSYMVALNAGIRSVIAEQNNQKDQTQTPVVDDNKS